MRSSDINPGRLRWLFAELLRGDSDLDAFSLDHFPSIYHRFSQGMDRMQKENLLLLHAPTRAELVEALKTRFPDSPLWKDEALLAEKPRLPLRPVLGGIGIFGVALSVFLLWRLLSSRNSHPFERTAIPESNCGALSVDDVFLVKQANSPATQQLVLDVRLRHGGTGPVPVNITRATVLLTNKTSERAPYVPSASYDLLIQGDRSEAVLAQRLGPGEVDRILIRLAFTKETGAYQYMAKLQLLYNGGCMAESTLFPMSLDAARWPTQVVPWPTR